MLCTKNKNFDRLSLAASYFHRIRRRCHMVWGATNISTVKRSFDSKYQNTHNHLHHHRRDKHTHRCMVYNIYDNDNSAKSVGLSQNHCTFRNDRRSAMSVTISNFSTTGIGDTINRKADDNGGLNRTTTISDEETETPKTKPTTTSKGRGIPLKDVIPKHIRLKFCDNDTEDIASDDEFDYQTYSPENDPDLTQYVKPYYHGPNGNYDFPVEEMDKYDSKFFNEMIYNMLHQHRSRSTPSVKRAHHAWWVRTKTLQVLEEEYQNALKKSHDYPNQKNNSDEIKRTEARLQQFKRKKDNMLIDEYASDDGTSIEYYSTECRFTIEAIRQSAIQYYALPSDQESPMSLVKPEEIEERTYDVFIVQYYDALRTKVWHTLTNLNDVMYYVQAERAIPIYVPKEYHKYVKEDDPDHWNQFRNDSLLSDLNTLDPMGIGDKTITNQERGRRIKAWIRKHPTTYPKI
jgi:hypothetical protein